MAALKIRRDDTVRVIAGKDKGKTGRVLRVEPKNSRVFVEGMNIQKRHQKARGITQSQQAGVIEKEGPIHISNVMLLDGKGNATRIGIKREDGQRKRISRKSGEEID